MNHSIAEVECFNNIQLYCTVHIVQNLLYVHNLSGYLQPLSKLHITTHFLKLLA